MIAEMDVLSESECLEVRAVVHELKGLWIRRTPLYPFYTLAIASYLDATRDDLRLTYSARARQTNPILRESFPWLYERVCAALSKALEGPATYCERFALPGFHVFGSHEIFKEARASVHCDLQYQLVDWEFPDRVDFTRPISFTLSIALPKFGAGLNLWDVRNEEIVGRGQPEIERLLKSRQKTYHPYKTGALVIHSGHNVHQIAAMPDLQPEDERITFQGHGVLCDNIWQLYW